MQTLVQEHTIETSLATANTAFEIWRDQKFDRDGIRQTSSNGFQLDENLIGDEDGETTWCDFLQAMEDGGVELIG